MGQIRVGCVSYLNSKPLVWGMDHAPDLKVSYAVPANLLDLLQTGACDVALLPVIDYQRGSDLQIVPGTCISADGHVWTVRLFSKVPPSQITTLYADVESHTSVVLCRILLKQVYGVEPQIVTRRSNEVSAQLLIGDKVIVDAPEDYPIQIDLAEAWKSWTGLPFVFAAWMARRGTQLPGFSARLRQSLAQGMRNIDTIVICDAVKRGWPADLARDYLRNLLKFNLDITPGSPQRQAMELFYAKAHEMQLTASNRPVQVLAAADAGE